MATSTTTSTTTPVTTKDMKSKLLLSMPRIPPKVYLKTVNEHITCTLCGGYLIDATTIVECLHSFCRSCIKMHLDNKNRAVNCPRCKIEINTAKPNIKPDATLQAIVYKLVPGLYEKELLRRRAFYKLRTREAQEATPEQRGDDTEHLIFSPNESISLMLEYSDNNDAAPQNSDDENSNSSHEINSSDHCDDDFEVQLRKPKYLQCPAIFTISNLKKFLLHKFSINPNKFCVEIMYKVKSLALPDHYKLMDVAYIFTWKRDAPMRFLYCVRAAHLAVPNIEQSAVIYDLPPSRFQTNSQLVCASDSTDLDQSSDADSEARSDRTREPDTNGSVMRISRDEPINSTSDEPSVPSSCTLSTTKIASSTTVTSTSVASTSSKLNSSTHTSSLNGNEGQKKESLEKSSKESVSSPTTSGRLESMPRIKTEPLSPSPEKQQQSDRRSNGASPKPNTSKSRNTPDVKSSSPSRTKSIMTDSSATRSSDSMSNRNESKTVKFSDKPSSSWPTMNTINSKPISTAERPKGRLLFNKDENAKSLSPPLSAENEYDFDQHLLKEEFSEKKDFFEKIHLKPRTDSPLVQSPKMPKIQQKTDLLTLPTNLSKDKDNNRTTASTTTTTTSSTNNASASSSTRPSSGMPSLSMPSSSSSSSSSSLASPLSGCAGIDKQFGKRPEKTSKRKSREPVKNVPKAKCASPNERIIDTKWDSVKSTIISTVSPSSPVSTATTSRPSGSNNSSNSGSGSGTSSSSSNSLNADRAKLLSQLTHHKNHQKSIQNISASSLSTNKSNQASSSKFTPSSKSVFKTPILNSSKESSSSLSPIGLKPSTSESETSIIIQNNIQRPTQADTPRPSTSFNPIHSQHPFIFSPPLKRNFLKETEIQEIRSDDANKEKVYGPPMSFAPPYANFTNLLPAAIDPMQIQLNHLLRQQQQQQQLQYFNKMNKQKKPILDMKRQSLDTKLMSKPLTQPIRSSSHTKSESAKQQQQQQQQQQSAACPFFNLSAKLPKSLTITVTNDGNEPERQSFSTKNNSVVNSIDIVKLPIESGETNTTFASPSTSSLSPSTSLSADNSWQSNKNINNQAKQHTQQNNQIDSTSQLQPSSSLTDSLSQKLDSSFQAKFIDSLKTTQPSKTVANRSNLNIMDESQKRKIQQQLDDKVAKVRKLQPQQMITQQKASPTTQRPVPDLLIPKDDKKLSNSSSSTNTTTTGGSSSSSSSGSSTGGISGSSATSTNSTNQLANSKNSQDRKSPTISASNVSSSDKSAALSLAVQQVAQAKVQQVTNDIPTSKYMPLQTSSTPIWVNHCTPDHKRHDIVLAESFGTQSKKSSGTFVD